VVEHVEGNAAIIRFTDLLEKGGKRHSYSCRERLTFNDAMQVEAIVQEDIPEEKVAVRAFMNEVGVVL
jgi:hypothetical protein